LIAAYVLELSDVVVVMVRMGNCDEIIIVL